MTKKIIITIGGILPLLLLSLSCEVYHLSDNSKYRNYFPIKDENIISPIELEQNKFDFAFFLNPDSNISIQYIQPKDINFILNNINNDLLLIFYNPNGCGAEGQIKIAKFAESKKIPYVLISRIFSPQRMKELYLLYDLDNKNQYILPTTINSNDIILRKMIDFISEVCQECNKIHQDDMAFTKAMILSKDNEIEIDPLIHVGYIDTKGLTQQEYLIDWIKEKYNLEK